MTAADLLRADARARADALAVDRSFIVQAPAGSGKTELLTQRFLALLPTVERPEALLAITFTRKAAAEMRNRILEALRHCGDPQSSLRAETRELAIAALAADRKHDWQLLANPGRLRVMTIDALNLSLARRLPVLSGLGAGLGVEEDARPLYELAAERLLAHLPAAEPRVGDAVALLLEHLDNNVGRLMELVAGMLQRREAWLPVLPDDVADYGQEGQAREALEAGRAALVDEHLQALVAAFPGGLLAELTGHASRAAEVLRQRGSDSPIQDCTGQVPDARATSLAQWCALAAFALTSQGEPRRSFDARVGVLPANAKQPELAQIKRAVLETAAKLAECPEACELLHQARELPPRVYDETEWGIVKSLLIVLRIAAGELKGVFAERRTADYPEFAAAARQALGPADEPTDTALALDATLRHVLVDEFQDTSEAQVELLRALTAGWQRGDGRTLFLVGDPMQSIYRFRNAEVGLFLDVRDRGLGDLELEPLTLRINFRSTAPLVEWVNECFAQVLPAHDDVLRGAVSFAASVPAPKAATNGGVTLHPFLRRSRKHEAQQVADLVQAALGQLPAGDAPDGRPRIAVLVQGRGHLLDIVAELGRRSISCQATDIDPLGERPGVLDALALTRALSHLGDRAAWLGVLRAPWCGLTLGDCHTLLGDDLNAAVLRLLREVQRRERLEPQARARLERCLPVLEQALTEIRRYGLRDAVERAWHALGGPATLDDERELDEVNEYFATLGELEADARGAAVDLGQLGQALEDLYAPSRPRAGTAVELLTIHKSKGLQYDTVIVPGLERIGRSDPPRLLQWLKRPERRGGESLLIAPVSATGADERNPLYVWLARLESEKLLHEKRRLLYVAATRAERALHLLGSCPVDADRKTGELQVRAPARSSALGLLWADPRVATAFDRRLAELGDVTGEEADEVSAREPPLRRVPAGWTLPELPPAPRVEMGELPRAALAEPVEFDWATETARHVGTLVHRELQRLARDGARLPEPGPALLALVARYRTELAELGVPEDRREAAAERVVQALQQTLGDERGRWTLAAHRDAQSELALTGRYARGIVSVVIDRTFLAADGVRWIIDYKTSSHEGADVEAFLDNERERYRPQLEKYAALLRPLVDEPVRLGLYFPLLKAWREWESVAPAATE